MHFHFAQSQPLPTLRFSYSQPASPTSLAPRCSSKRDAGILSEAPEVWVSRIYARVQTIFLPAREPTSKQNFGITEFECCWGRGSDGVDMEVSEHQDGGAAEAFARAALGSKPPSSSALLGSLLFLLSSVPMTVPAPPNSLYPILPPKSLIRPSSRSIRWLV